MPPRSSAQTANPNGFRLTEHAKDMAMQRGVRLSELADALSDRSFVINNSLKDPESDRYVLRFKDLRIVWEMRGGSIVVLTIFR
jgi:hypothetical protein